MKKTNINEDKHESIVIGDIMSQFAKRNSSIPKCPKFNNKILNEKNKIYDDVYIKINDEDDKDMFDEGEYLLNLAKKDIKKFIEKIEEKIEISKKEGVITDIFLTSTHTKVDLNLFLFSKFLFYHLKEYSKVPQYLLLSEALS